VLNRAVSGWQTRDILRCADELIADPRPRIIVYYCGSNDINAGEPAPGIVARFRLFAERAAARLPGLRLAYLSVIRAPQKRDRWEIVDAVNRLAREHCASARGAEFIDINPALCDAQGRPCLELYQEDQLHLRPPAYARLAAAIRPALERMWAEVGGGVT